MRKVAATTMDIIDLEERATEIFIQADVVVEFLKPLVIGGLIGLTILAIQIYSMINAWIR